MFFFLSLDRGLRSLRRALDRSRRAAYAEGTFRNLSTQWRAYLLFCFYFGFVSVPSSSHTLCLYAQFLSSYVTPGTIRNYLNGVRVLHLYLGHEFPFLQEFVVKITLKGISRLARHTPQQALAITVPTLLAVRSVIDVNNTLEVTVFTVAIFAFFLLSRLSNLLPVSAHAFDSAKDLCRRNILFLDDHLVVIFNWSKTIQFGERRLVIPLLRFVGSSICPVEFYTRMLQLIPAPPSGPAFVISGPSGLRALSKSQFVKQFRSLLVRAGIPLAHSYSGHSFRRGGATWAFGIGVPGELIQVLGDWKSECYKRYFEFSLDIMCQVGERMRDSVLSLNR